MQNPVSPIIPISNSIVPDVAPKKSNFTFLLIILTVLLLFSLGLNIYQFTKVGLSQNNIQPVNDSDVADAKPISTTTPRSTQQDTTPEPTRPNRTPGASVNLKLVTQDWASMPGPNGETPPIFNPVTSTIVISKFDQKIPLKSFSNTDENQLTVTQYDNSAVILQFKNLQTNPHCYPINIDEPCTLILGKGGSMKMGTVTQDAGTNYTLTFE